MSLGKEKERAALYKNEKTMMKMSRQLMWQKLLLDERKRYDVLYIRSDKFTDKQLLCSKKQDATGLVGIRQYHQQPVLA